MSDRREIRSQGGGKGGRGFNLSAWAIEHSSLTRFFLILTLVAGAYALSTMGQKEDPDFTFRAMVVQVVWPGASVREMQEQVVDKIEREVQETPHLDFIRSYARAGSAVIFVNLKGDSRGREVSGAWYQVRKKIGDIRNTLPEGVAGPFFNDEFGDTYIALYAITGQGFSYPEMKDYARDARDHLLRVEGVEKVDLLGTQDEKVFIEIPSRVLAERNITPQDIQAALAGQNTQVPAGTVETAERSVRLDVQGTFLTVDEIRALRVRAGNETIRLGDIATVRRGLQDPPVSKIRYDGQEAVVLGVVMADGFNVTAIGEALHDTFARIEADLPLGVQLGQISDQPKVVVEHVGEFLRALAEALLIVLAVSLLALGWRAGLVVALTIPLVLAATFLTMSVMEIDLQRISLGALIISLGLLVDDAMIAVEMMERKLEEGFDKLSAATFAYQSTAFPMLTGTLITVAGFIPVGFAESQAGEYVSSLFWVTGIALIASWIAAVIFTPWIGYSLLKVRHTPEHGGHHDVYNTRFYRGLRGAIEWCVRRRKTVIAFTLIAFAASIAGFAIIPQQFFPASNRPEILVDLWMPEGTAFTETEKQAVTLEKRLKADGDVGTVTTYIGEGSPRFYLPLDQQLRNQNFAQLLVMPKTLETRDAVIERIRSMVTHDFPTVRFKVDRLFNGPPVGWAVQIRVQGPQREEVRRIADEVTQTVRAHPQTFSVHDDWLEAVPALKLDINQDRARAIGVTTQAVRQTLQGVLTGISVAEFREGDETIAVVLREPEATRGLLSTVESSYVKTASGAAVPLSQVARVRVMMEPGIEWRRDRLPTITVRALVPDHVQSPDVTQQIYAQLQSVRDRLPLGYRIEMQGAVEESATSQASINAKMPLMVLVILVLLMIQLQSFGKTMLVVATAPLGITGAAAALLLFSAPFGFVAILGVIALAGIIMRNSVILVDQIRQDLAAGIEPFQAIAGSAVRRFRPIALTAAAAVLALVPISLSPFWGPMALAMMGGLIAATILTLTFLPALYAFSFRVKIPAEDDSPRGVSKDARPVARLPVLVKAGE